jgi:hypothetical protein
MNTKRFPAGGSSVVTVLACLAIFGCGGAFSGPGNGNDAGPDAQHEAGSSVGPCGANGACPPGSTCLYPVGSCAAEGVCIESPAPGTPECELLEELCGCGQLVTRGCNDPEGYASGPSTGSSSCGIEVDAGPPDATPPEAGTPLGPCGANGVCPSGSTCLYPVGSCAAEGVCIESPAPGTPECELVELLCGCGQEVTRGCNDPAGYASGPSTGSSSCATPQDAAAPKPIEAGTPRGACGDGGACPTGSACFYPIGSCAATGQCIENPPPGTPECGTEELLCGCGRQVVSGCGFPNGYASGPTTGASGSCVDSGI